MGCSRGVVFTHSGRSQPTWIEGSVRFVYLAVPLYAWLTCCAEEVEILLTKLPKKFF